MNVYLKALYTLPQTLHNGPTTHDMAVSIMASGKFGPYNPKE